MSTTVTTMPFSIHDSSDDESTPALSSTTLPTTMKRKKGAQSTKYTFTDAQDRFIDALMLSFEKEVNRLDPNWVGKCAPLNVWKAAEIKKLMDHELFYDLVNNGAITRGEWERVSGVIYHCLAQIHSCRLL